MKSNYNYLELKMKSNYNYLELKNEMAPPDDQLPSRSRRSALCASIGHRSSAVLNTVREQPTRFWSVFESSNITANEPASSKSSESRTTSPAAPRTNRALERRSCIAYQTRETGLTQGRLAESGF